MSLQRSLIPSLTVALAATLTLAACDRDDVAAVDRQADRATAQAKRDADQARREGQRAVERAEQKAAGATAKARATGDDAAITTAVTAQLKRDGALDTSKIDVDTTQGHVVLRGSAPDEPSKERARQIALSVDGVKAVDNYLTVAHNNS